MERIETMSEKITRLCYEAESVQGSDPDKAEQLWREAEKLEKKIEHSRRSLDVN